MITFISTYLILIGCIIAYGFQENFIEYCPSVKLANYSVPYNITVDDKNEMIIYFPTSSSEYPYRVFAFSKKVQPEFPVLITVRQQKEVTSWEIPLLVESKYENEPLLFFNTSRTLCHNSMEQIVHQNYSNTEYYKQLSVSISTFSTIPVTVLLLVKNQDDFYIKLNTNYTAIVSPGAPKYFYYRYSKNDDDFENTVILDINSLDPTCLIVSIQNHTCPVFDLNEDVTYDGKYETINTRGGMLIKKKHFPLGFFVVFVAKPDNFDCDRDNFLSNNEEKQIISLNHTSTITFSIKNNISSEEYAFAIALTLTAIAGFCGFFIIISCGFCLYEPNKIFKQVQIETTANSSTKAVIQKEVVTIHTNSDDSSITGGNIDVVVVASTSKSTNNLENIDIYNSSDNDETPLLQQGNTAANHETKRNTVDKAPETNAESVTKADGLDIQDDPYKYIDMLLKKADLKLSDLVTKDLKCLSSECHHFFSHIITVGIFYGTPVLQLVIMHQRIMTITGNLDICYYNFLCAHPLWSFNDFNHIFSNLGYIFAGSLFVGIALFRDYIYIQQDDRGIPKHYGLYYAMGTAVIMEGLFSGFYHVCPNQEDFQFDTSFMFVLAVIFLIKLYQNRHPDINATAHVIFLLLSLTIMFTAIGIFENHIYIWVIFIVVYSGACIFVALKIYFVNNIKRGCRLYMNIKKNNYCDYVKAMKPVKIARFWFLLIALIMNLTAAFTGIYLQTNAITDFGTFVLGLLIMNTVVYILGYILFKICYKEKFSIQSVLYFILCIISWSYALKCYEKHSMEWTLTAAESRQKNTHCILHMKFYDYHDIWHLLSASALFFSCMVLLTIDDKLMDTPHSEINIF